MKHWEKVQSNGKLLYMIVGIFLFQTLLIYPQENNKNIMGVKAKMDSQLLTNKEIELSIHIPDGYPDSTYRTHPYRIVFSNS